jgi:cobyrinic acid a,c-diamide synthase
LSFEPESWLLAAGQARFRIAVALDAAFDTYYPETLDLLEAAGAELCDFSPLTSERIPDECDVVFFGSGDVASHAEKLASNHCLKQSLHAYAASGGRIYAEGGGLAYLCREVLLPGATAVPMTGLLPAAARWTAATELCPTEINFHLGSWLAPASFSLRGYSISNWNIEPNGPMLHYARDSRGQPDFFGAGSVIGSRLLINLAANRHLLRRFFEPYAPAVAAAVRRGLN